LSSEESKKIANKSIAGLLRIRFKGEIQRRWAVRVVLDGKEQIIYWPIAYIEGEKIISVARETLAGWSYFLAPPPIMDYMEIRPADLRDMRPWDDLDLRKPTDYDRNQRFKPLFKIDNSWECVMDAGDHVLQLELINVQLVTEYYTLHRGLTGRIKVIDFHIEANALTEIVINKLWSSDLLRDALNWDTIEISGNFSAK